MIVKRIQPQLRANGHEKQMNMTDERMPTKMQVGCSTRKVPSFQHPTEAKLKEEVGDDVQKSNVEHDRHNEAPNVPLAAEIHVQAQT